MHSKLHLPFLFVRAWSHEGQMSFVIWTLTVLLSFEGGEELFGLTVTEYPNLQRIRKELGLLQKLYSLYNSVIDNVNGYYDILWQEIDIEKINNELLEYQNR